MPSEPDALVINTGPLITLGRAGALEVIKDLPFRYLTPAEVAEEIATGARQGHPIGVPSWVQIRALRDPPSTIAVQSLDRGEAAVISLALELEVPTVCIDEWRGRRVAKTVGLDVTGSLGLLGRAKTAGLIPEIKPWVKRLVAVGARLELQLVQRFLATFGER